MHIKCVSVCLSVCLSVSLSVNSRYEEQGGIGKFTFLQACIKSASDLCVCAA